MNTIQKLDRIEAKITSQEFRKNIGSANEVSYYIFDYDPKDEMVVRSYVEKLADKINSKDFLDYNIVVFDLYEIMINYLNEEGILDDVFEIEDNEGFDELNASIRDSMGIDGLSGNYYADFIKSNIDSESIVFITGVGKIYPIVRAHKILKNLHLLVDSVPVIVFVPGSYNGVNIQLFGRLSDNYYRAFKLID